jgi:anti-anti-sigma factor
MAFSCEVEVAAGVAKITLQGELDASVAGQFKSAVEQAAAERPQKLVLFLRELEFMASAGLRVLIFAKQKMGADVAIHVVGASGPVLRTLEMSGFHHSVYISDTFEG